MRSTGAAHLGRAATSALVVVVLSLAFHLLAGGSTPDLSTVGGLTAATTMAAATLTRRRVRPVSLVLLLALAQVALHLGFESVAPHGAHGAHGHSAPLPMTATHAIATVLSALVLLHGQALLRRGLAWYCRLLLLRPPTPTPTPRRAPVAVSRLVPTPSPGTGAATGRAPPRPVHS